MPDGRSPVVQFQRSGVLRVMKRAVLCYWFAIAVFMLALPLPAQQAPAASSPASASAPSPQNSKEISDKLAQLDQRVTAAQAAGDNAWMLTSAALVLMMTGPGLVRRKNTLAIMMQSFAMMGLISVLWALVGYSLAFGGDGKFIGDFSHAFLRGVGMDPNIDYSGTIPHLTFMIYQMMFAVITPALITGATAERMKFSGTVLFMTLWFFIVYAP